MWWWATWRPINGLETEALVNGLEIIPPGQITYHNIQLAEMDIDAILKRKPRLALVDELAHTNVPGSRHAKRYADVEELLDAGIDVYTTINVQHIESLNDVVAQITGMTVRETIPDSVIDEVTDIELIDLPPDELIKRLQDGKVYVPDQAQRAIEKFFRKGNLTALRELTMRRAAERVDDQMRALHAHQRHPRTLAGQRTPVGLHQPGCAGRAAHPHRPPPGRRAQGRMVRRLCGDARPGQDFPGTARPGGPLPAPGRGTGRAARVPLPGESVAASVLEYAHRHNVTKIIAGKPVYSRWIEFLRGSRWTA